MTPEALAIQTLLMIANKEGEDVPFMLNRAQTQLDEGCTGRDLVPKARQRGITSYVLARFLIKCLRYENRKAVVISHDQESTQRMLNRVRYYLQTMRGGKAVIKNDSASMISFPKRRSVFYIGTAGAREFGRGDTITDLHCSEVAFWPNMKRLVAGLFQAVPKTGEIFMESTGNGFNEYHKRCMRARAEGSSWALHFIPWHTEPEYSFDLDPTGEQRILDTVNPDLEEPEMLARGLTPGQLAWRRAKLEEMDYDLLLFMQEYPMTLDECFQASSQSIFQRVPFQPVDEWARLDRNYWGLTSHPRPDATYVAGVDVAGGVGQDYSVLQILCLNTGEQVAQYRSNGIDPEAFGEFKLPELLSTLR